MDRTVTKKSTKSSLTFAQWIKTTARARGDLKGFIENARAPGVKLPTAKSREKVADAMGHIPGFDEAWRRYENFAKRGSQSKRAA